MMSLHFQPFLQRWLPCLLLLLAAPSCGTMSYNQAWDDFSEEEEPGGMVGRWQGTWVSEWNGHDGGLRCMLTSAEEDAFLARFHSTYGWFLSFRHEALFHVVNDEGGALRFEGEEDLGALFGGLYRYSGTVTGDRFEAHYEAENGDHGTFSMERVDASE